MPNQVKSVSRWAALIAALALSGFAHAAPESPDESVSLIDSKAMITKIEAVSQSVVHEAADLVDNALGLLGVRYRRGGSTAETGFDCSGFVKAVYAQTLGLVLPRRAEQQAAVTQKIDQSELQPGDLVFFNTMRRAFSHVGMYIGDGKFVHSPRSGEAVRVEEMDQSYWRRRFNGARRVLTSAIDTSAIKAALSNNASDREKH